MTGKFMMKQITMWSNFIIQNDIDAVVFEVVVNGIGTLRLEVIHDSPHLDAAHYGAESVSRTDSIE